MICYNCKGNGYVKFNWEATQSVEQCKVCDSQGELKEDNYYHQSWTEGAQDSLSIYYGPPLDPECFKNYQIYKE